MMPSIEERAERVLEQARELAARVESWADYSNALFNPCDGIVKQTFPTLRERREFTMTKPYAEIYDILRSLREKFGVVEGGQPKRPDPGSAEDREPRRWQAIETAREQGKGDHDGPPR